MKPMTLQSMSTDLNPMEIPLEEFKEGGRETKLLQQRAAEKKTSVKNGRTTPHGYMLNWCHPYPGHLNLSWKIKVHIQILQT